jgi:tRNA modification GTPase
LLEAVLAAGARLAEAGEFSKRAFLNGRMDLTQAEAVCDFIQAKTDRMAHVARAQLDGSLGSRINRLYDAMTAHCADIEHQLDFEEGELPDTFVRQTATAVQETQAQIQQLIASWNASGHLLRDGALVVISGKPNAGKSSLLNALLGRDRAIVHDAPGTTRDAIEESCALDGIPLRLVDTAGLRDTADAVEQEGVSRAHRLMRQADINLYLIDGTTREAPPRDLDPARTIIVFTKSDLAAPPEAGGAVAVSSKTGEGFDALGKMILRKLGADSGHDNIVNARHAGELRTAHEAATHALAALSCDLVIAANHLRDAAEALGRIVGRCYADDLLDTVFSRFCVGK